MLHKFFEDGYWFEAKRFGLGSGLPIAWQGWALLLSYIALVGGVSALTAWQPKIGPIIAAAIIIPATIALVIIAKRRTRGGWRWRWGKRD